MNGKEMHSTSKLRNAIAHAGPNTEAKFEILRDRKKITLKANLGELPAQLAGSGPVQPETGALEGASIADLTADLRRRYDVPSAVKHGAIVTSVHAGSPAQRAGLRPGDVILELNRKPIKSASEFRKAYQAGKGTVLLLVQRKQTTVYLAIKK